MKWLALEADKANWEQSHTTKEAARAQCVSQLQKKLPELSVHHPMVIHIRDKLERWKHSVNGYLMMKSQHLMFWTALLSLSMQHLPISPPDCVIQKKGIIHNNQDNQLNS